MIITEWGTVCGRYRREDQALLAAERLASTTIDVQQFEQLLERPHLIDGIDLQPDERAIVMSELAEHARFHAHVLSLMRTQSIAAAVSESTVTAVADVLDRTRQAVSKEYRRRGPMAISTWSETAARALEAGEPYPSIFGGI